MKTKKSMIQTLLYATTVILLASSIFAHDYIPGAKQSQPILLQGGNLYTISNGIMENSDILFENGKITAIGNDITLPDNTNIIDVSGKNVYPGMIAPNSSIGLIEIGALAVTNDKAEIGRINPDVHSHIAYNPDSEIIPTTRSNGVTSAHIVPSGGLLSGQSSLINMDGWTKEDAMVEQSLALHLNWPRASVITAWWMDKSAEDQKKESAENIKKLYDYFDKALAYKLAKDADPNLKIDSKLDAMYAAVSGNMPVYIHASDLRQIEMAVSFAEKYKLNIVIVGGRESWKITKLLVDKKIPVILSRTQANPMRHDYGYDLSYKTPNLLFQAGVKYCLSYGSASNTRNLPFNAGQAVAFGLPHSEALRSVTLSTAEILGVSDRLGSLEIGKSATIIVSTGDLLDIATNNIELEFIDGKTVNLDNRHKEFYRKYKAKN